MSRLEDASAAGPEKESRYFDLPLRLDAPRPESPALSAEPAHAARLPLRAAAFAADAAVLLLVWAAAVLAAIVPRGQAPEAAGAPWAACFLLLLSFLSTVPALLLFGRTVGMAVAGLQVRGRSGRAMTAGEAVSRWLGTLATAASLGLVLLATAGSTPADRWSGRPLEKTG